MLSHLSPPATPSFADSSSVRTLASDRSYKRVIRLSRQHADDFRLPALGAATENWCHQACRRSGQPPDLVRLIRHDQLQ
jgi:hypothetical protein